MDRPMPIKSSLLSNVLMVPTSSLLSLSVNSDSPKLIKTRSSFIRSSRSICSLFLLVEAKHILHASIAKCTTPYSLSNSTALINFYPIIQHISISNNVCFRVYKFGPSRSMTRMLYFSLSTVRIELKVSALGECL